MTTTAKILIVDDEPDIATVLKLHLEDAGYETAWASDGKDGLEMLLSGAFDLTLLDIKMPRMSGVEVLRRLRESGNTTAVIMMTAHGSEELAVECMKSGAMDYFPKPFALDDMLQRVQRAISYRQAIMEKERLEQEKDDFFFMLSHDLKNPITALIGSIDIVREKRLGPLNDEQADYLLAAIDSCHEVVTMIDNLLDIQRFEAGKIRLRLAPNDVTEMLSTAVQRYRRSAEHETISLRLDLPPQLPAVSVDRNAFIRIIANLLGNAVKFTPPGGEIVVTCRHVAGSPASLTIPAHASIPAGLENTCCFLKISVRDTGSGIPAEDLMHIFERYVQANSGSARERGGAGLGLAFCKMAVDMFGGMIWAESELDQGSEFIILLPCLPEATTCSESQEKKS